MRDPKEFRERYARWKKGELVYKAGRALPSFAGGKETEEQEEVHYTGEITQGKKPSGIERAANWILKKTGNNRMGLGGALQRAVDEVRDGRHPLNGLMKTGGAALFPYVGTAVEGAAALDAANEITKNGLDIPNTIQLAVPTVLAGAAAKKLKYPSKAKPASLGAIVDYHNSNPNVLTPMDKNSTEMLELREFYRNDVLPRFEKQMNKTGRTASMTADELIDQTPYRQGPFLNGNYGGYYGPTGVVMNSKYAKNGSMLSHETNHALRQKLGYTKEEDNILKEAYTFSNEYLKKHPGLAQRAEKSATNNEVRRAIAMKYKIKDTKELDSIIDNMPDDELMSMYTNSYGIDFKKSFKPGLKPQRKALKSVASIVPLLAAKGIIQESFEDFDEELPGYGNGKETRPNRPITTGGAGYIPSRYTSANRHGGITPEESTVVMNFIRHLGNWIGGGPAAAIAAPAAADMNTSTTEVFGEPYFKGFYGDSIYNNERGTGIALGSFLVDPDVQKKMFQDAGYIIRDDTDYGLVKGAVDKYTKNTKKRPIFVLKNKNDKERKDLLLVGRLNDAKDNMINMVDYANISQNKGDVLYHAGSYPVNLYIDDNNNLYQAGWDFNDYGNSTGTGGAASGYNQVANYFANKLDKMGNPSVVFSGYRKLSDSIYTNDKAKASFDRLLPLGTKNKLDSIINSRTLLRSGINFVKSITPLSNDGTSRKANRKKKRAE